VTDKTTDLVSRLRKLHAECANWSEYELYDMLCIGEAADELGRVVRQRDDWVAVAGRHAEEIERLRARVKWLEDWKDACEDTITRLKRKVYGVDVPAKVCVCGEPNTVGVQHRTDGPCFVIEDPRGAEPK